MRICYHWLLLMIITAMTGCGYHPLGYDFPPVKERPTLAIPPFANRSTEVGLETLMANAFQQAFAQTGNWRLVARPEEADLVLEGSVRNVENTSVAFYDINQSVIRRITIQVDVSLRRRDSGKVTWKESTDFSEDYIVQPDYHVGEATKAMGIRRGAITLARRVADKVLLAY